MSRYPVWAIVPAAGIGRRMGEQVPKQYLPLAGRGVIQHALDTLLAHPRVEGLVVALAEGDRWWSRHAPETDKPVLTVRGGPTRAASVRNALRLLSERVTEKDWALVHDAARPCLHPSDLNHLITAMTGDPVGGLLALPVSDALKRADSEQRAVATVERRQLWRALTPQMFRVGPLLAALDAALADGGDAPDESAAMEAAGFKPHLVEGRPDNLKVTRPRDLPLAEAILAARHEA